ncbi:MAG: AAA family ATPase, partial [Proteobacteria bacterium]|nr:AAA family ATPase [Pseudomonadota bacterium]
MKCPKCQHENPDLQKFCGECGQKLAKLPETEKAIPEIKGERKHVTVLFSDLSGYTNMSEQLDPEEVKEIMSKIFGEIAQIVDRYEGFIEKFIGDAIVAIFGATKAYEDNPIRAIRAAREIHNLVESLSPKYEEKIGHPLSMHTGINTGLVVTGKVDLEKGTHGISGDTINLAARLSGIGKAGDILVDLDTHSQAEGYFDFEDLGTTKLKGKTESVQVYKVIASRDQPRKVHRIHGLRSRVVGRKIEIAQLSEAIDKLLHGKGSIISICGEAGTGKSRLIEEFKATLDFDRIQWREGHAYPYAQN